MADYIDRKKIWPALNATCVPYNRVTQKAIESIPAADVRPVVLCRDCMLRQYCKVAQYLGEDGFCSNAEKREG